MRKTHSDGRANRRWHAEGPDSSMHWQGEGSWGGIRLQGPPPFAVLSKQVPRLSPLPPSLRASGGIHFQQPPGRYCVTSFPLLFTFSLAQEQRIQPTKEDESVDSPVWDPLISFPPLFSSPSPLREKTKFAYDDQLPKRCPTSASRRTGFSQSWSLHSFFFTVREPTTPTPTPAAGLSGNSPGAVACVKPGTRDWSPADSSWLGSPESILSPPNLVCPPHPAESRTRT